MIQIICDKCGKKIDTLSNNPKIEKNQGIQLEGEHICAKCLKDAFEKK